MAESTTPTKATGRPARTRTAAAKPATKATPAKAAPAKAEETTVVVEPEAPATQGEKRIIELEPHPQGHTKSFTKWAYPADEAGVTGTVYGPLGATGCKVLFVL